MIVKGLSRLAQERRVAEALRVKDRPSSERRLLEDKVAVFDLVDGQAIPMGAVMDRSERVFAIPHQDRVAELLGGELKASVVVDRDVDGHLFPVIGDWSGDCVTARGERRFRLAQISGRSHLRSFRAASCSS